MESKAVLPQRSSLRIAKSASLQKTQQKTPGDEEREEKKGLYPDNSLHLSSLVGKRVSKFFEDGFNSWFDGTIDSFEIYPDGPHYRISYDDGDAEDLSYKQTLKAIDDFKKRRAASLSTKDTGCIAVKVDKSGSEQSLLGKRVSKYFGGNYHGWFDGTVISSKVYPNGLFYRIRYDDGDTEDLPYRKTLKAISNYNRLHATSIESDNVRAKKKSL